MSALAVVADEAAAGWEELYREAVPRVYRALLATLRDPRVAEDALHDAFAEGLRRPPPRHENLAGWLFRVAVRRARRHRWPFARLGASERSRADEIEALRFVAVDDSEAVAELQRVRRDAFALRVASD